MASLKMSIPHQLTKEEALTRIKGMLSKLKEEQKDKIANLKENWNDKGGDFKFTSFGFDLEGLIKVTDSTVDIDADLPFAVAMFKGKIKEMIEKNAVELLA